MAEVGVFGSFESRIEAADLVISGGANGKIHTHDEIAAKELSQPDERFYCSIGKAVFRSRREKSGTIYADDLGVDEGGKYLGEPIRWKLTVSIGGGNIFSTSGCKALGSGGSNTGSGLSKNPEARLFTNSGRRVRAFVNNDDFEVRKILSFDGSNEGSDIFGLVESGDDDTNQRSHMKNLRATSSVAMAARRVINRRVFL